MTLPSAVHPPAPQRKAETLVTVSEGWARVWACFSDLSAEQLETPGVAGGWRPRDVASHLDGWFRAGRARLQHATAGSKPDEDYHDFDAWNARFVEEAVGLSAPEVVDRMRASFEALETMLREADADLLARHGVADWVEGSTWGHFGEHVYELWHFRGERGWLPEPPTLETMPATKDEGLKTLWVEYDKLYGSLLGLDELQLAAPGVVGDWSARDIVAHVAAWQRAAVNEIPRVLAGQGTSADVEVVDDFNARAVERGRGLTLEGLMAEYHSANNHFFAYARTLVDGAFAPGSPSREWLLLPHGAEHYPRVWSWRRTRGI